jgi:predicted dehydrogenase/threonine dehydrogenase-like Zn-dependent dehydrogenase
LKQILQDAQSGALELVEVPAPRPAAGQVLVQNHYSVMSPGTDKMSMSFARKSMLGKARVRPDLVNQVMRKLQQEGPVATYRTVTNRLAIPQTLGYSCAGVVTAIGTEVRGFSVGDRVACAGAGFANHAEFVAIPENLVAKVPDAVDLKDAAFSTLGAIALQGIRVAEPTLGEIAAVVGLGLIGQLAVQLLKANGCRVLGIDLNEARVRQSLAQGAEWAASPGHVSEAWSENATGGYGVDLALVTAASDSADPLNFAAELCRRKGRIAFVGATPIELDRRLMFEKELDLRMSTSYGPGRYDSNYEEHGFDYPVAYVRWTENRNLQAFLSLVASDDIDPGHLNTELRPFDEAVSAYEELEASASPYLAVVFEFDSEASDRTTIVLGGASRPVSDRDTAISFIGAGNYARAVLLPLVRKTPDIEAITLVTTTGASARKAAERFSFRGCSTDTNAVMKDPNVELVFIATRHDSHASLTIDALEHGKAVWVEKPVALGPHQLRDVLACLRRTEGFLAVGYNRRFSRHTRAIQDFHATRSGPMQVHYRIVAPPPPRDSWVMDRKFGGGRVIGEACHFIELCNTFIGHLAQEVYARTLVPGGGDDTFTATLSYPDGSIATLDYLACASDRLPKEVVEVSADGRTAICENFRRTSFSGRRALKTFNQDKGQAEAIREVIQAFRDGRPSPFSIEQIANVSAVTFAILDSAARGESVAIDTLSWLVEDAAETADGTELAREGTSGEA